MQVLARSRRRSAARCHGRLRAIVDDDAGEHVSEAADHGPAADALKLAAYLDGGMSASERDAFEAELVRSPARRDDLIAAVDWIEQMSAHQAMPPADATALAIALEREAPVRSCEAVGRIQRLDRMAAAAATMGHRNLGAGHVRHRRGRHRHRAPHQSAVPAGDPIAVLAGRRLGCAGVAGYLATAAVECAAGTAIAPAGAAARRSNPVHRRDHQCVARLPRRSFGGTAAGSAGGAGARWRAEIPADRVRAIAIQPQLVERLTKPRGDLPTQISARLSLDGELAISIAK